jgi:hypothetical protein
MCVLRGPFADARDSLRGETFNLICASMAADGRPQIDELRPFAMAPSRPLDRQGDEELRLLRVMQAAGGVRFQWNDFERIAYMIEHFVASRDNDTGARSGCSAASRDIHQPNEGANWTRRNEIYRNLLQCVHHRGNAECEQFVLSVLMHAMDSYRPLDGQGAEELRLLRMLNEGSALRRPSMSYDDFERIAYMIERYDAAQQTGTESLKREY